MSTYHHIHISKKTKYNDALPQVVLNEYTGHEVVPMNVTHVRFDPTVENIDNAAFEGRSKLIEVELNDGLRQIGDEAFYACTSLQSINIPSTVTKISKYAFASCTGMREVVLNEGLRSIENNAFGGCKSLQSITIPSTTLVVCDSTFWSCTQLREVVLNEGLTKIGYHAFHDCSSLQSVTIPSTVDDINSMAFSYCTNIRNVVFKDGIKRIKSGAFVNTSLERIIIPSTVIEIGKHAFRDCSSLKEVVIVPPLQIVFTSGVCSSPFVERNAFRGCSSLERFKFPSLSTRLNDIIKAGQLDIEAKIDDIPSVEWRGGEISIPPAHRQIENRLGIMEEVVEIDEEKVARVEGLIAKYELREATSLFELALWKARLDQADTDNIHRDACRIEVPGLIKDTILQYISNE